MDAEDHRRADHGPYIAAVRGRLQARDIRVASTTVTTAGDGRREATLELRPDQDAFAEPVPPPASARWDEQNGWRLRVPREGLPSHEVRQRTSVLPAADDVAAWAVVALAHPELSATGEERQVRDHAVPDPEFEARLARYAAGR